MRDIGIAWNVADGWGDWADVRQDAAFAELTNASAQTSGFAVDGDLVAAVLVSLFTDRRASPDFVPPDGTGDRRGWWADAYEVEPIGSRLWQLERAKRTRQTLLQAKDYCTEALAWLQRDGIASSVNVLTFWAGRTTLGIRVAVQLVAGPARLIEASVEFQGNSHEMPVGL